MKWLYLLFFSLFIINSSYCTNGELWFYISDGPTNWQFKFEKIPGEYYYDENFNVANPPDFIFTKSGYAVIQADAVHDNSGNGTPDDNGNKFVVYYGKFKASFNNYEGEMELNYLDCEYRYFIPPHYSNPDSYFKYSFLDHQFIRTLNGGDSTYENFTNQTYNIWEYLKYPEYAYQVTECFKVNVNVSNLVNNQSYGDVIIDGTPYASGVQLKKYPGTTISVSTYDGLIEGNNKFRIWDNDFEEYYLNSNNFLVNKELNLKAYFKQTFPITFIRRFEDQINGTEGNYTMQWVGKPVPAENLPVTQNYHAFNFSNDFDIYNITTDNIVSNYLNTNWQFAFWENGATDIVKNNLQITAPTTYTAYYKGHFRSNSITTFGNNSQRKIVRDDNGFYHMVYQSLGKVWYTKSNTTNFNGSWAQEIPIEIDGTYSNPSIDYYNGKIVVVFESQGDGTAAIQAVIIDAVTGGITYLGAESIDASYFGNAKPVVGFNGNEVFMVYKESATAPLKYTRFLQSGGVWSQVYGVAIPYTDASSVNPTVAAVKTNDQMHIVWQQSSSIKYIKSDLGGTPNAPRSFLQYKDVSFGAGNSSNTFPTVINYVGNAKVAWIGNRKVSGSYQSRTTFRDATSSGVFSNFGSNVASPNINKTDNNSAFILAWSENNGNANYFTDELLFSINSLNTTGKDLQICNGSSKSTMYATSFKTAVPPPYYFIQSNDIQSLYTISKTNSAGINKGREGVVAKGSGEIYFTIGDVSVNGENISFKTLPDSFSVTSVNDVNGYVRTIPFALTDNSQFLYSVQYGITDSTEIVKSLSATDVVAFRVELVDETTEEVLGVFDNVSYTKQQAVPYENFSYQVSPEGIGNRTVYLRLVTTATEGCSFSLGNLLDNQNIIAKKNVKQLAYKSASVIKDYAMEQNYPNPFNPVTTITYQLPKSGSVTLKIFDILGNEVKTLVNEQKEMGRYTIQFNASSLASGMYVYQLRANEYTSTKKMMLLK